MKNNKLLMAVVWGLGLMLCNVMLFGLSQGLTATFWITFGFVWGAFAVALIVGRVAWKKNDTLDQKVLHIPAIMVLMIYLLLQIPISIIFSLGSGMIPWKAALLIQTVILVVAWLAIIGSLAGNDYISKVNERQKNHHVEL